MGRLHTIGITVSGNNGLFTITEELVQVITRLISECSDQAQQLFIIRDLGAMPYVNALHAIQAGKDAVTVVNALEKGRSKFWNRLINRKGRVVELAEKHEELANRYRALREKLNQPAQPDDLFLDQPQDNFLLESEMNNLVAEIREQDGFKDFLLPPL